MKLIAQTPIFGEVTPPYAENSYPSDMGGIIIFFVNILRLFFLIAGIFIIIKVILAGFAYITAGGEPKKLEQAWANIWQSLVGMLIMASAFVLAGIIGQLLFGNAWFILYPRITGIGN